MSLTTFYRKKNLPPSQNRILYEGTLTSEKKKKRDITGTGCIQGALQVLHFVIIYAKCVPRNHRLWNWIKGGRNIVKKANRKTGKPAPLAYRNGINGELRLSLFKEGKFVLLSFLLVRRIVCCFELKKRI